MNKKIVCWIGNAPNHKALVVSLSKEFEVVGVVIDKKSGVKVKRSLPRMLLKLYDKWRFRKIDKAWSLLQDHYRPAASLPSNISFIEVESINDPRTLQFTKELQPALVVVSGTSLIKEPLVSLSLPIGIMNLHTGLSPYVKGGPNCTNWCIANNEWNLVGNTVMWISAGIDSGNIITTEKTDISNENTLPGIHLKVMQHAHDLYIRAIRFMLNTQPPYPSVVQSTIDKGRVFLTKMWTPEKKKLLLRNLSSGKRPEFSGIVKTIPLPG